MRRWFQSASLALLASANLYSASNVSHPFVGVTCIERSESVPREIHMHIVQIDLAAPGLRFKLTPASGKLETTRQTTLDFLRQEHAQIAINAHFFTPFPSTETEALLIGLAASDGTVYSAFELPAQSFCSGCQRPGLEH